MLYCVYYLLSCCAIQKLVKVKMKKSNEKIEKKSETPKLTPKQLKFCEAYLITRNATQSAIEAGYSKKTAAIIGAENLKKPYIEAYLGDRIKSQDKKLVADTDEILQYLTRGMRGELTEEVVTTVGTGNGRSRISKTMKKIGLRDANKCAEMLGKINAMFTEKQEINATVSVPQILDNIEVDVDE